MVKASKISSEADGKDKGEGGEKVAEEINKDLLNLYDGLKMTERILLGTLAKHGLERFDPAENGDRFDPNRHDASFMAPVTEREDGSVFTTVQKGFLLNGRVVRVCSSSFPFSFSFYFFLLPFVFSQGANMGVFFA